LIPGCLYYFLDNAAAVFPDGLRCNMRLVFATKALIRIERSFEGFPLLIGDDGWPVEPTQSFLWHILNESAEPLSTLIGEAYRRRL